MGNVRPLLSVRLIPERIVAGDTTRWTESYAEYPSSTWTLTAYVAGPSALDVVATAESDESFTILFTAQQTAAFDSGEHTVSLRVTNGDEAYTLGTARIYVKPNPKLGQATVNIARKMIALIDEVLTGQLEVGKGLDSYSVSGKSYALLNRMELMDERAIWVRQLKRLNNARKGRSGLKSIRLNVGR